MSETLLKKSNKILASYLVGNNQKVIQCHEQEVSLYSYKVLSDILSNHSFRNQLSAYESKERSGAVLHPIGVPAWATKVAYCIDNPDNKKVKTKSFVIGVCKEILGEFDEIGVERFHTQWLACDDTVDFLQAMARDLLGDIAEFNVSE